jgi:multiple sugar transport system permease protein
MTAAASSTAVPRTARPRRRRGLPFSPWHLLLAPTAIVFALPFVQMFLASLSPASELIALPTPLVPSRLTIDGFVTLFTTTPILLWLGNTVVVSATAIVSHLVLCSLAGYGFARLHFRGRNLGFFGIVATIMIPTQVLMIPTYVLFSRIGLIDSLGAAIVPWLASAFGIFLMRQFFLSLPAELEEAGLVDGCTRRQVFFRIVLPLARPALATLAVFTLLSSWNDLVWPLIAISNQQHYTLQLGITSFQGAHRTDWSLLMAGNVVATLPLILFFLAAQKQFVQTMTFSGLKG